MAFFGGTSRMLNCRIRYGNWLILIDILVIIWIVSSSITRGGGDIDRMDT